MEAVILDYTSSLIAKNDGIILRSVCSADDMFANVVAQRLRDLLGRKPSLANREISTRLQGNLCEFCVWDLGEQHWNLYSRLETVTANARSPWRDSSKSGIDIVAVTPNGKNVYLIEVKSSQGGGSDSIFNDESSLKADFDHLFEAKAVEERIWGSIYELIGDLGLRGKRDIAENVKNAVGTKPEECAGVRLVGVVICKQGETIRSHNARNRSFTQLNEWLVRQGWKASQLEYRTIEVSDFKVWLDRFIEKVTS